jgi:hypothetical protein
VAPWSAPNSDFVTANSARRRAGAIRADARWPSRFPLWPFVKRTDPFPELGRPDGRTRHGTGMCHRHGMCGQDGMGHRDRMCHRDGMCHRELFRPSHLRASFRSSAPKAGAYFFTRFRPFHLCHHCGSMSQESCGQPLFSPRCFAAQCVFKERSVRSFPKNSIDSL